MKKRFVGGLLAAVLTAGLCVPAQALGAAPSAAMWMGTKTAAEVVRSAVSQQAKPGTGGSALAFGDVERVVRAQNTSIKAFDQTLEGIGATDVQDQFMQQYFNLESQIAQYQKQINDLDKSIRRLQEQDSESNSALIRTLKAQKSALEASLAAAQSSYKDLEDSEDDADEDLGYTYTSTERQLGNAADQIVMGAETAYISMHTLDNSVAEMQRNLAALDRSIAIVQTQINLGAATALDLLELQTQRENLTANIQTLENQRVNLQNNLSILCGYGANEKVEVGELPEVTEAQIAAMDYDKDLATALKNSYSIWAKEDAVEDASRDYEDNVTNTLHAFEAAKIDLAAEKENVTNSFRQQFNSVKEKHTLLQAAESAYTQESKNFAVKELQYQRGAISKNDYESAKDTLETAEQAEKTARINLFTAYNTYKWALRGVMS